MNLFCHRLLGQQHQSQWLKRAKQSDKAGSVLVTTLGHMEIFAQR